MKIMAIGAHHDDIEIGCGGSILKQGRKGNDVLMVTVTDSGYAGSDKKKVRSSSDVAREAAAAAKLLGVKDAVNLRFPTNNVPFDESLVLGIRRAVDRFKPDIVYSHWTGDAHLDHRNVAKAAIAACRHVPTILAYQSNWYRGSAAFDPNYYEDISETFNAKLKILRAYKTEFARRGEDWIRFLSCANGLYGLNCGGVRWAEGFMVIKMSSR